MKQQQIKAKVNGVEKTINFDTTKLFRIVEDYVADYNHDWEYIAEEQPYCGENVFGENVGVVMKPFNATFRNYGCEYCKVDFNVEIYLYNPLTKNEIIIETLVKDVELEGMITDPMKYYGLSWKDFM